MVLQGQTGLESQSKQIIACSLLPVRIILRDKSSLPFEAGNQDQLPITNRRNPDSILPNAMLRIMPPSPDSGTVLFASARHLINRNEAPTSASTNRRNKALPDHPPPQKESALGLCMSPVHPWKIPFSYHPPLPSIDTPLFLSRALLRQLRAARGDTHLGGARARLRTRALGLAREKRLLYLHCKSLRCSSK